MQLRDEYLANNNGDEDAAMVEMISDLTAGDPDTFKAGYSEANAVLAVADVFGRDSYDVQRALDCAKHEALELDLQRRREQADRAARLNALHTGTYKAGE